MSGLHVYFLCMSGSQKTSFFIFHIVNLKRNRTWFPENFHKWRKLARSPPRNGLDHRKGPANDFRVQALKILQFHA
ncbi:hypothetical protein F2N20_27765 [Escherichia coli]|nr:hypothetical protein [Escherichia coli]EFD4947982.1 hypothetical protein [Escherichia coli]EFH8191803.1 hypothetical protein [Escherichia coli]